MIIQGSPDILRGPRGLNGFADFGAAERQIDPNYLTPDEVGQMLVGTRPNPNNLTMQDMVAAGKYQEGLIEPPENLRKKNADRTPLIDQDVNYYGFLESKEYSNWMKSIEGQMLTMDIYDSPYFGMQGSGAYRGLDRVYEAYKSNLPINFDMCPPGSMMVDGFCVSAGGPKQYAEREAAAKAKADAEILAQQNTGISPMLILAAAAAFFIGG